MDPNSIDALEQRKSDIHKELNQIRAQIRAARRKDEPGSAPVSARAPSTVEKCCPCCVSKGDEDVGDDDDDVEASRAPLLPKTKTRHFGTQGQAPDSVVTDEADAEDIRSHFDYPSELELIITQMAMSLGYTAYAMTAWLYCGAVRQLLFRDCTKVWPGGGLNHVGEFGCEVASFAFWTLPLYICIILHLWYYRDLLCTRLYYEMLAHNVFLDFENVPFFAAFAIRVMCVWILIAFFLYPLGGSGLMSVHGLKITAPFWVPLASFVGGVLYASWDLETRLLSLSKYVEREFDDAKIHIDTSLFMPDYVARQGFIAARTSKVKEISRSKASTESGESSPVRLAAAHTTGLYIRAIATKAMHLEAKGKLLAPEHDEAGTGQDSLLSTFRSDYWVVAFLFCPHLEDERAVRFRRVLQIYKAYAFLMVGFLIYLFLCSGVSHLQRQGRIEESTFTNFFHVERFLIMPVAKPPEAESLLSYFWMPFLGGH